MPHANTEDQLVEQPAIQLLSSMGWATVFALDEVTGPTGTLGRQTTAEVVLVSRLRTALERLNPTVPPDALAIAIDSLTRNRSTMSHVAANREVYDLLKNGIPDLFWYNALLIASNGIESRVGTLTADWERFFE
jgi:type I restriction enzyme R subunit